MRRKSCAPVPVSFAPIPSGVSTGQRGWAKGISGKSKTANPGVARRLFQHRRIEFGRWSAGSAANSTTSVCCDLELGVASPGGWLQGWRITWTLRAVPGSRPQLQARGWKPQMPRTRGRLKDAEKEGMVCLRGGLVGSVSLRCITEFREPAWHSVRCLHDPDKMRNCVRTAPAPGQLRLARGKRGVNHGKAARRS